jgi:dipeptidase
MGSDMVVALASATVDGRLLFGYNHNGPPSAGLALKRIPGRSFSLGEKVTTSELVIPQARQTYTVLGLQVTGEWGLRCGANERGVAAGQARIQTRRLAGSPGLTGPELVRLILERATSARSAVEVATDLIGRFGQGNPHQAGDSPEDVALLLADGREAFVLEGWGRYWALQQVGRVKALTGACLLRQDWDRLAPGLSELAIRQGWWPEDGQKLDFTAALGRRGPDHEAAMHRWGQSTLQLEQQSGQIDGLFLRRLLREQSEQFRPASPESPPRDCATEASVIIQLREDENEWPAVWCALGAPTASVYLPLSLAADLPAALKEPDGRGCWVWQQLVRWQAAGRTDAHQRAALRVGLAGLQERLDEDTREFLEEVSILRRGGEVEAMTRLANSFMQHNLECFEELGLQFQGQEPHVLGQPHGRWAREEEPMTVQLYDF